MSCCEDYPEASSFQLSHRRRYTKRLCNECTTLSRPTAMRYTGVPLSVINCSADVLVVQSILGISAIARRDIACNQRLRGCELKESSGKEMPSDQYTSEFSIVQGCVAHVPRRPSSSALCSSGNANHMRRLAGIRPTVSMLPVSCWHLQVPCTS